jgi:hypothetical protein
MLTLLNTFFINASLVVNTGLDRTAEVARLPRTSGSSDAIATRIGEIIGLALSFVGIVFLILMIYGGYTWMTARGDSEKIKSAKQTITNAVIGLIIIGLAYGITTFVINAVAGPATPGGAS